MARYIDADKFAERIRLSPAFKKMAFEGDLLQRVVLDILGNAPTADVQAVRHGEWIRPTIIGVLTTNLPHCSVCENVPCDEANFCPNCGADMRGDNE